MKAKAAARTPRRHLRETRSSWAIAAATYKVKKKMHYHRIQLVPSQKATVHYITVILSNHKGQWYLLLDLLPDWRLLGPKPPERPQSTGCCSSPTSHSSAGKKGDALSF